MTTKGRLTGLSAAAIAAALSASPAFAQVTSPAPITNPPPTPAQISSFATGAGINITCARAYLAANHNTFPQSLTQLTQFMVLAPAADLCSPGAVASAEHNMPAPTDAEIAAYAPTVGSNPVCIHAFVLHANSFPTSVTELSQFQALAPAADHCRPTPA